MAYLVVDSGFNRANYSSLIGQTLASPPSYAQVRKVEDSGHEAPPDNTLASWMIKALVSKTINDITYEQMSRIVRRLGRMSRIDRGVPKRVADVLADELGPHKALQYLDKALAAGQVKAREYDEMRAALLLPMPRQEIPAPTIRRMAAELVGGQEKLRGDFRKLTGAGQQAFRKPFEAVDEDVKRMRKAIGL